MEECVVLFFPLSAGPPHSLRIRFIDNTVTLVTLDVTYKAQSIQLGSDIRMSGNAIGVGFLTILKPDAFVVVFGLFDEGSNSAASNGQVYAKIPDLTQRIKPLGIDLSNIFIDFIIQNRVSLTSRCPGLRRPTTLLD